MTRRILQRIAFDDDRDAARAMAVERLRVSALGEDAIERLGLEALSASQTAALGRPFRPRASLKINYFDLNGEPMEAWPGTGPYFRVRYLGAGGGPRYMQPSETPPEAYFPRGADWEKIAADSKYSVVLTEGELKAASATAVGFPTIGIGGVRCWRAEKWGLSLLKSLRAVSWSRRIVHVAFDSDVLSNPDVARSLHDLSTALTDIGARPHMVTFPDGGGAHKAGIDDFIAAMGGKAHEEMGAILSSSQPLGLCEPLWSLNDQYAYVMNPGGVYDLRARKMVPSRVFSEGCGNVQYREVSVEKGRGGSRTVSAADFWLKWPARRSVPGLQYEPGKESTLDDGSINLWRGWGAAPKAGDAAPFLSLVGHLLSGAAPEHVRWFLQWCAYPIQHPGTKMATAAVLCGRQGTGKNLLGDTIGRVYGEENYRVVTQQDLHAAFTGWREGVQFIVGDEISSTDRRADSDNLKRLVTETKTRVNIKYVPEYDIKACYNLLFVSNHVDAFFLEDDDRRYFIHTSTAPKLADAFYSGYVDWLESGGDSIVSHYLRTLDLTGFRPKSEAPRTSSKDRMTEHGLSDLGAWVRDLIQSPDGVLRLGGVASHCDLWSSTELLELYAAGKNVRVGAPGMGRELARAGVPYACGGKRLPVAGKPEKRYWAVRNRDRWASAQEDEAIAHLDATEGEREISFPCDDKF